MDNDLLDLADQLSTIVGMIFEDSNALAVQSAKLDVAAHQAKLEALSIAADDVVALIAAAKVLVRLG